MDIVTHGLAGALLARAVTARPGWPALAAAVGGALAPDLDVVARLWDPLAPITVHRTVTHSFIGGLPLAAIVAEVVSLKADRESFFALAGYAYLGVLSHVALDLLTPFGTAALWPLSPRRFGLGWLYVIDPVVFGLLATGLILSFWATTSRAAGPRCAWGLLAVYVVVAGLFAQAADAQWAVRLAEGGVSAGRRAVVPIFPGPWRWLGVAETEDSLYRATASIGGWGVVPLTSFPKAPVDGFAGLERSTAVREFRAFARFPWRTVTADGGLRRVEYRDLAFEDHPFGGPMTLRLTVDPSGSVRDVELGHRL